MARLLVGTPFIVDSYALNDFEAFTVGTLIDLNFGWTLHGITVSTSIIFNRQAGIVEGPPTF